MPMDNLSAANAIMELATVNPTLPRPKFLTIAPKPPQKLENHELSQPISEHDIDTKSKEESPAPVVVAPTPELPKFTPNAPIDRKVSVLVPMAELVMQKDNQAIGIPAMTIAPNGVFTMLPISPAAEKLMAFPALQKLPALCSFNGCKNIASIGADKCTFHRNRKHCSVDGCLNQVYARKLCVRHGGKRRCVESGCNLHARMNGKCSQHGGIITKRYCLEKECNRQAHARRKCVRHGGGRKCKSDGCDLHSRAGGLCVRHGHDEDDAGEKEVGAIACKSNKTTVDGKLEA